ncbi:DUF3006 domain-containing protein [Halobacillus seohaensis]|uniref:DUF3006 domain-containing protein n=1 Tax=Halobacillus seohaensis TaxID=447421 RepID=A0ABW2EH05_9BACI
MNKYTVDRFEGNLVILLKKGDESIQKELSKEYFPDELQEGDIVRKYTKNGNFRYEVLAEETKNRKTTADNLLEKIKRKNNTEEGD